MPTLDHEYPLKGPYFFKICPTYHRVASQGYTVYERKKRLKPEYRDQDPQTFGRARAEGKILDEFYNEPVLSFSGDTRIEFLDSEEVRKSRLIILEMTYWDKKKTVENARHWGHIHLDELIPRLESLKMREACFDPCICPVFYEGFKSSH